MAGAQQGGRQGPDQRQLGSAVGSIEQRLAEYLNGSEIKSILTPGEYNEWKLKLKAGEIVVAEARSEAFDPALEIVDPQGKSLFANDDRYPGDQRPLLFWRCPQDGEYGLRVRCFHDKTGGQFFVRFKTYDSVDVPTDEKVEKEIDATKPFFLRIPMAAGQVKDIVADYGGEKRYLSFRFNQVVFPNGLPERAPSLSEPLSPAIKALVAPVAGDYYLMYTPSRGVNRGFIRVGTRTIVPTKLDANGAKGPTNRPAIWEVAVKAGDFLRLTGTDLNPDVKALISEAPNFGAYDVSKPETNPFFPQPNERPQSENPPIDVFPGRARDGRVVVFRARRDAKLWIATDAAGPANRTYGISVAPAAAPFTEDRAIEGKLRIGYTDYWAVDAKVGDVMTMASTASGFVQQIVLRDPDLSEIRNTTAGVDEFKDQWRMIVEKPGRYLLAISCMGDGGSGEYTLNRKVFRPKEFSRATPASGTIERDQVQIWKFTATPNDPLLLRWTSSNWDYEIAVYDDKGQSAYLQQEAIDANNRIGILKVTEPRTFIIVLTGKGKSTYSIELNDIPGVKPPKKPG